MPKRSRHPAPQQRTHRKRLRETANLRVREAPEQAPLNPSPAPPTVEEVPQAELAPQPIEPQPAPRPAPSVTRETRASAPHDPILIKELKHIGVIAALILVTLIALAVILD